MRKVELRMNEQEKYEVIKELVDHNGNKNRASKKLGISRRQVDRLIIKYKEKGKAGFVHGNRTRIPINALDNSISEDIILLYKSKYQDWNFYHFKEFLKRDENIDLLKSEFGKLSVEFKRYEERFNKLYSDYERLNSDFRDLSITNNKIINRFNSIDNVNINKEAINNEK